MASTPEPPSTDAIEDGAALLREGYDYGGRRFREHATDWFRTRLVGRRTVVAYGREASEVFSEGGRMSRDGAIPAPVMHLLQDEGSVQTLEGLAHAERKAVFLRLLDDEASERLADAFEEAWNAARREAAGRTRSLYDVGTEVLTRAALAWTGVTVDPDQVDRLASRLAAMVDDAPRLGPRNWAARIRRRGVERWAARIIRSAREPQPTARTGDPVVVVAGITDLHGRLVPEDVGAVELINLLRPIVAIARYLAFSAHALHRHREWWMAVSSDERAREAFAQEVRRWYPFFPALVGTTARPFRWRGREFRRGDRMMLDLYATNHDAREWDEPERFDPRRFLDHREPDRNTLIPQGGGDAATGHRCPGEGATLAVMRRFLALATADPAPYDVPDQDLRISLRRLPALPVSRMLVAFREMPHAPVPEAASVTESGSVTESASVTASAGA